MSRVYRARGCVKKDARRTHHSGELYGFDRVSALIATRPDAHAASEVAVAFGQDDDIAVLTVTRLAVGVESTTRLVAPELVSAI